MLDRAGQPVLHEGNRHWGLSSLGRCFVAGIQHHLPALCAVTTPSVASYFRLRPNRWAPVLADVGSLDRGTAVRICAASGVDQTHRAQQFNVEFRVADATASPYLALAALIQAGLDGVREQRDIRLTEPRALPASLAEALDLLEANEAAPEWLGSELLSAYLLFKRAEIKGMENLDESEICRRYGEVY